MKLSLKVIIGLWVILLLFIGGLFYSAYSRLKPETFIALVTEQIQKNYPGAKLNVDKVDYRLSVDFNLNLKNVILTRSGKIIGSIGEVELKVPWWLLLLNRGNAQINLSDLVIYVDHSNSITEPAPQTDTTENKNRKIQVVLPGYLADAKYSIRAKNISIKDLHNSRRYFRLSKLLVREFQYGKNSAFELNIPIEIQHKEAKYTSELWLFGDVTPQPELWKLNYRGEFKTRESNDKLQFEDLIIDGKASLKPSDMNLISDFNLLIEKLSIGTGSFIANENELSINMDFQKVPLSFLGIVDQEVKNPYLTELVGFAQGSVRVSKKADQEIANLRAILNFDGNITLGPQSSVPGKWKLVAEDTRWESSFISPKSEVSFFRRSIIDFKRGMITQYNEELGFTGLDFKLAVEPVMKLGDFINLVDNHYFNTVISFKKCQLDKKFVDGNFRYGISPDQKYYQGDLSEALSTLKLNYQLKRPLHQISLELQQFTWIPQYKFLETFFAVQEGKLNGKVEGKWSTDWTDGVWLAQVNATDLKEPTGKWINLVNKISQSFTLDALVSPNQNWSLSLKNKALQINAITFENADPAKVTGLLQTDPKLKSFLVLNYPKNFKWKPVRKEVKELVWQREEL